MLISPSSAARVPLAGVSTGMPGDPCTIPSRNALAVSYCSKRGVDIEKLFKGYDTRYNGMVRRTEFLEVLSKLGLYILEQRDSLAADSKDGDGDDPTRRLQQRQLSRLRRSGAGEAVAKLHGAKGDGDFKVPMCSNYVCSR